MPSTFSANVFFLQCENERIRPFVVPEDCIECAQQPIKHIKKSNRNTVGPDLVGVHCATVDVFECHDYFVNYVPVGSTILGLWFMYLFNP